MKIDSSSGVNRRKVLNYLLNYLYIAVPIALMFIVIIVPFFQTISYSLTRWSGFSTPKFVGFKNYILLFERGYFLNALSHNATIALAAPMWVILPLVLAVIIFQNPNFLLKATRMSMLVPYALSMTIVGIIFVSIFHVTGPLNQILKNMGFKFLALDWLGKPGLALSLIIGTAFWRDFGWITVIYLAGLSNIDERILDAAKVDGANWRQTFIHVIIPGLNPVIVFITALVLIADFRLMFDYVYIMTKGGPGRATETVELHLYEEGFRFMNMGYACAVGTMIFLIIVFVTYFQIKVMSKRG